MRFNSSLILTSLVALSLAACANKPAKEDVAQVPSHVADMSVDMPEEIGTDTTEVQEAQKPKTTKAKKPSKKKVKKKKTS